MGDIAEAELAMNSGKFKSNPGVHPDPSMHDLTGTSAHQNSHSNL
jgi:hypothetical protein